jgi:hypothetical protein
MMVDTVQFLARRMSELGATKLYVKELASNDHSKTQIYLGGSFEVLQLLPFGEIKPSPRSPEPIMHADVELGWIGGEDLTLSFAREPKLILYPQYPEVRLSGFVQGSKHAPPGWFDKNKNGLAEGRILFLGVVPSGSIIAYLGLPGSSLSKSYHLVKGAFTSQGVLVDMSPILSPVKEGKEDSELLLRLKEIHEKGWINAKRLTSDGEISPCYGRNCGGPTLETELGVSANGKSEPDFLGWEIKQHATKRYPFHGSGPITLLTPEPDGGEYSENVEEFVDRYGSDSREEHVRYFTGRHFVGRLQQKTKMTILVEGFDAVRRKITNNEGGVRLISAEGTVAASWSFAKILAHWCRKHNKAAYVPSQVDASKKPASYRYGSTVRLCRSTDPLMFLSALSSGTVYYDPGTNWNQLTGETHRRNQFRVNFKMLSTLYAQTEDVDLLEPQ